MNFPRFPLFFIAFSIMAYMHAEVSAGPLSLSFARSFRSGREIRTPFKSPGIFVARGFGKRNAIPIMDDGHTSPEGRKASEAAPTVDKFKPTMYQAGKSGAVNSFGSSGNRYENERFPIDWLFEELSSNPNLARIHQHRLIDSNGDGKARQLTASPMESFEYY